MLSWSILGCPGVIRLTAPFILLPQVWIASHTIFPKISDIQMLPLIFYTTLKLLPTWLSQTLQICERSYFMLKIVAKTPIIFYTLIICTSRRKVMILERFSFTNFFYLFFAQFSKPRLFSI